MSWIKDLLGLNIARPLPIDDVQFDRASLLNSTSRAAPVPDVRVDNSAFASHSTPRAIDAQAAVRADLSTVAGSLHGEHSQILPATPHDGGASQMLSPPTIQPAMPHGGASLDFGLPAQSGLDLSLFGSHGAIGGQVVFIDSSVRDLQALLAGIKPGMDVVLLDSHHDALDQIAETLAGHHGITAVHIIADGKSGQIDFSAGALTLGNLATGSHLQDLSTIDKALSPQGDLMIWSCDTAQGQAGQSFMDALAHLTGADVAGSTDITGAASLGGNWMLESHTGPIQTGAPLTQEGMTHFDSTLGVSLSIIFPAVHDSVNGYANGELGFSYGTAGDSQFDDLFPGGTNLPGPNYYYSSNPSNFTQIGTDKVVFFANDATHGRELWITDGTEGGTSLLKDIDTGSGSSVQGPGNDPTPVAVGSELFFAANDGTDGVELWETDGTTSGTQRVTQIGAGGLSGGVGNLVAFNNHLYFSALDGTSYNGYQSFGLWETDGTTTTHIFTPTHLAGAHYAPTIGELVATGGHLFFSGYNGDGTSQTSSKVYISDGTTGGTHLLDTVDPMFGSPGNMTGVDGKLWWSQGDSATSGSELWVSDGTTTKEITIAPGTNSSSPSSFIGMNGEVFFSASDGTHGFELWESDGTQGGTVMVKDINPNSASALTNGGTPDLMAVVGNTLYFAANDGTNGTELWKTNGQVGNATMVKDINPIAGNGSDPIDLQNVNGTLYFFANDGAGHEGLFKSDGTSAGTIEVASDVNQVGNSPTFSFLPVTGGVVLQGEPDAFTTDEATAVTAQNLFADNGSGADTGSSLSIAEVNDDAAKVGVQITLASGAHLTVNSDGTFTYDPNHAFDSLPSSTSGASNLTATDSFTYLLTGASSDTSVTITITGLDSNDLLIGTGGGDTLTPGTGNDTVQANGGNDVINMGANLNAADKIDGGTGNDTVNLNGDYTGGNAVTMNATTMVNVESVVVTAGHSYNLTTNDATVGAGLVLTVDASALGSGNSLTFNGSAETDGSFDITGGAGADVLTGGAGNDVFKMQSGGADTVNGGGGIDIFHFGNVLTAADSVNGGSGTDKLVLDGDYTAGNALVLGAATLTGVELVILHGDFSYGITTNDANVASGQTLTINARILGASDALTFNGSAEADGRFSISAGAGNDVLTGGAGNDNFNLTEGGNDTAHGGGGDDTFILNASLTAADSINGGTGNDIVRLFGDYSGGVTFAAATMTGVERVTLGAGHDYSLTTNDGNVAAGDTMRFDGSSLGAGDTFTFNGSAETDGGFIVNGGTGNDSLTGGAGHDVISAGDGTNTIKGGGGADSLTGGSGVDTFVYGGPADSSGVNHDTVHGFDASADFFDTTITVGAIDATVAAGRLSSTNFDANLITAIGAGQLGSHEAVLFTPTIGNLSGHTFLIVDVNGTAGYQAGADLVIDVTGMTGTLTTANFI